MSGLFIPADANPEPAGAAFFRCCMAVFSSRLLSAASTLTATFASRSSRRFRLNNSSRSSVGERPSSIASSSSRNNRFCSCAPSVPLKSMRSLRLPRYETGTAGGGGSGSGNGWHAGVALRAFNSANAAPLSRER